MPVLVQHFIEHRQFDPSTTFWDFIREHYNGKFEVDEDYERDNQLPFRTSDYVAHSITISEVPESIRIDRSYIPLESGYVIKNDEDHLSGLIAEIWQPPRIS